MTKKDYILIANAISEYQKGITGGEVHRMSLARLFASELLNTNPRFEAQRFIDACTRHDKETVRG